MPAGRRAWTSASRSPPGAHASVGRRRQASRGARRPAGLDLRAMAGPPTRPGRSRGSRGSGRIGIGRAERRRSRPSRRDRAGRLGGPGERRMDDRERRRRRDRQRRAARAGGRAARRRGAAWRRPVARERRLEPGPGSGAGRSAPTRRGGRGRASRRGRSGIASRRRGAGRRRRPSGQRSRPSRIVHSSMTDSWARIASATAGRHVVVEGEDHQRVGAWRGPPDVHRADVHVGLAERLADPADHPRPVAVVGDQHHVGRLHVEAVVVQPGEPDLAAGDRPADGRRPAAALARQAELRGVRAGVGRLALDDRDPAGLRQRGRVDEVDPLRSSTSRSGRAGPRRSAATRRPPRARRRSRG